ncbi:unnamed protein product [Brassica napus]|uniref:(rape) hypothetical protein n=1 Tax=Brassica napus TaxID=3708 RepID=A0A816VQB8_BRANA|nr:unnamed protein product [Brassica napus]
MNMCYKVHSSESCLAVLQEQSLAIEFNWFWFHSCKQFEAISMLTEASARVLHHIASAPEEAIYYLKKKFLVSRKCQSWC